MLKSDNFSIKSDYSCASEFFRQLLGDAPKDYLVVWEKKTKLAFTFSARAIDKIVEKVLKLAPHTDVYFQTCPVGKDAVIRIRKKNGRIRGKSKDAASILAFWIDLDFDCDNHKGGKKYPTKEQALKLIQNLPMQPTIAVSTGGGFHLYWCFKKHWIFKNEIEREDAEARSMGWQRFIENQLHKFDPDLCIDPTGDLARVLRIPGTYNFKNMLAKNQDQNSDKSHLQAKLQKVSINSEFTSFSRRYDPSDFDDYVVLKTKNKKQFPKPASTDSQKFKLPDNFDVILENVFELQKIWERKRTDMKDQSPSGYEMALANLAVDLGWSVNEFNSVCFFWRKKHGEEPNKAFRIKYYMDTLGKVSKSKEKTENSIFPGGGIPLSDVWNAKAFSKMHQGKILYCYLLRVWKIYDGVRWKNDDRGQVVKFAKQTAKESLSQSSKIESEEKRTAFSKHAIRTHNKTRIDAMIKLAQDEMAILPQEFDRSVYSLNVSNGTLDLRSGIIRDHDPKDLISKLAPVKFNPEAQSILWNDFLQIIFNRNQALIEYIQKVVGYAMTGDVRHDCFFILYGTGCNGKTTFLNTIQKLLGDYARQMPPSLLIKQSHNQHPTAFMELHGTRFIPGSEVDEASAFDEALIKKLTGGDKIKARGMYKDFIEFEPTHKFFISVNHLPRISGTDEGIWRRIKIIPFNVRITEVDEGFRSKLLDELPGILNWALDGARAWYKGGGEGPQLIEPPEITQAVEEYRGKSDNISEFFIEKVLIAPQSSISASTLYREYGQWCLESGIKSMSQTAFGSSLSQRGFTAKKSRGIIVRHGITLKENQN